MTSKTPDSTQDDMPVYLEASIQTYLAQCAHARGITMTQLVNELLQKSIELIEIVR
jgi:predicted DNA-binding ribbon-helix-helix protein